MAMIAMVMAIILFRHRYYYEKKTHLASRREQRLFRYLNKILPKDYHVHCQSSLISLLVPADLRSARMVWAKRMDYVITDADTRILLVIELDDPSHERKDRRKRDKFVNKTLNGKHPLLRLTTEQARDKVLVKRKIEQVLDDSD